MKRVAVSDSVARRVTANFLGVAMAISSATQAFAAGQSSANFAIPKDTINAGVGEMTSSNFRLNASVGEPAAGGTITGVAFRLAGGFRGNVTVGPAVLNLLSVVSRKLHNGTAFDLNIANQPITGSITIEPRTIGAGHVIIFHFDATITAEGAASALDQAMNSAATVTLARSGADVIATLNNVGDNKRLTLTLTGVNATTNVARSLGFLVGDVNNSKSVNAADIIAVKARNGTTVNAGNVATVAKFDLNADGTITQADVSMAKSRSGLAIP